MMLDKYNYLVNYFRLEGETPEQAQALAWDAVNNNEVVARINSPWALGFSDYGILVFGSYKVNQKWFVWRTDGSDSAEGYGLSSYYEELTRYGAEILFN